MRTPRSSVLILPGCLELDWSPRDFANPSAHCDRVYTEIMCYSFDGLLVVEHQTDGIGSKLFGVLSLGLLQAFGHSNIHVRHRADYSA